MQQSPYQFSNNWFGGHRHIWSDLTRNLCGRKNLIIEVGVFEGAATTWMLDILATHDASRVIAIDPFTGSEEHTQERANFVAGTIEQVFRSNVCRSREFQKLTLIKESSATALVDLLAHNGNSCDLVYIDGSHHSADVLSDAVLAWHLLKDGGLLVFDDYKWDFFPAPEKNPRMAIDAFISCFQRDLEVVRSGYQMWLRKRTSLTQNREV